MKNALSGNTRGLLVLTNIFVLHTEHISWVKVKHMCAERQCELLIRKRRIHRLSFRSSYTAKVSVLGKVVGIFKYFEKKSCFSYILDKALCNPQNTP